jgi:hypothetical protein
VSPIFFIVVGDDVEVVSPDGKTIEGYGSTGGVFGGKSKDTVLERFVINKPNPRISRSARDKI